MSSGSPQLRTDASTKFYYRAHLGQALEDSIGI